MKLPIIKRVGVDTNEDRNLVAIKDLFFLNKAIKEVVSFLVVLSIEIYVRRVLENLNRIVYINPKEEKNNFLNTISV